MQLISVILLDNGLGNLLKQRQNFEMAQLPLSGFGVGFMDYMALGQTEGLNYVCKKFVCFRVDLVQPLMFCLA